MHTYTWIYKQQYNILLSVYVCYTLLLLNLSCCAHHHSSVLYHHKNKYKINTFFLLYLVVRQNNCTFFVFDYRMYLPAKLIDWFGSRKEATEGRGPGGHRGPVGSWRAFAWAMRRTLTRHHVRGRTSLDHPFTRSDGSGDTRHAWHMHACFDASGHLCTNSGRTTTLQQWNVFFE